MKKTRSFLVGMGMVLACGDPKVIDVCAGADCRPCEAESVEDLCLAASVSCGAIEATDRCGEARAIDCGACSELEKCVDFQCVDRRVSECGPVPPEGICAGPRSIDRCVGFWYAGFRVEREDCEEDEVCRQDETGAACHPAPDPCKGLEPYCTEEGNLKFCRGGDWDERPCDHGCVVGGLGPACRGPNPGSVVRTGSVFYDHFLPNEGYTGWSKALRPAAGLTANSLSDGEIFDVSAVGEDGTYEVLVPEWPGEGDGMIFVANLESEEEGVPTVVVRHPLESGGSWADGPIFSWSQRYGESKAIIREADGSGALQVFQGLLSAARWNATFFDSAPQLTAWVALNENVICEACYFPSSRKIVMSGMNGPHYKSDATIFHELGHYFYDVSGAGAAYGEEGHHCLGVPVPPAQALEEGHASWYAAELLGDSRIHSESHGTFYYWDIGARTYSGGRTHLFKEPNPKRGLDQKVNETWVAAVLWDLGEEFGSSDPIHRALFRREVREPSRYTAKYWTRESCETWNPVESWLPAPILADLLDALVCSGFPRGLVDTIVWPHYPYDSSAPRCREEGN